MEVANRRIIPKPAISTNLQRISPSGHGVRDEIMSKLNPNAQKWVDALRSGKYKQGKDCLAYAGHFCCLGVLCELALESGVRISKDDDTQGLVHYGGSSTYLPRPVRDWACLKTARGHYGDTSLADKNDEGFSFAQIAELIEANAEELGVSA